MNYKQTRWVARLKPTPVSSLEGLLAMPLGLDVWEHRDDELIVAASEAQLGEIERRRLAHVERLSTVVYFVEDAERRMDTQSL